MLKKILPLILCILFLCGCNKSSSKIEEISFMSWGSVTEVKVLKSIITTFEKENPNIKIKFMHIPQNYFQKLHLLFASNTAPDVIFINNLHLPLYAEQLEDLSSKIQTDKFYRQSIDALTYNKQLLAIPRDVSNYIFYINTDLVKPKNKWSIQDLVNVSQNATKNNVFGVSFEEDIFWARPYIAYFNETVSEDFDIKNSKGFKFYMDLRDKYKIAPEKSQIGSSTLAQMFLDQKIAIYLSGRWMYPKISENAKFNWEVREFPLENGYYPCDASGWAISKQSRHKNASLKFIEYLSSDKSSEYFVKTGLIVPANKISSKHLNKNEHNEKVFLEILQKSKNTPFSKNYKKLADKINSTF